MHEAVRKQYEAFPDPSPTLEPIGPGQLDRMDDNLHFGWSWHRHQYCYRRGEGIRILDAGCGTGLSTLALARLNPGSTVLGVDASGEALELARRRAAVAGMPAVSFAEHDLDRPLPGTSGPFDFIACRRVLGQVEDPARVLENLARALDPRGLLHVTLPSRVGRQAPRQLRRAVTALCAPGASLEERAKVGLELFQALRPDHPIRQYESGLQGTRAPNLDRIVAGYLNEEERDWTLDDAVEMIERAGLQFLFAATRWPWQVERVFIVGAVPDGLRDRVGGLNTRQRALLIDALDPVLHLDEYRIFACLDEFEPRVPSWPEDRQARPEIFDRLIPHRTPLADPSAHSSPALASATAPGRVAYRTVGGAVGALDQRSDWVLRAADGRRPCGELDRALADATGVTEPAAVSQDRWIGLADSGLVLLESPDRRQHVDCRHLGRVLDRLDCACPRRWVRACERHEHCTLIAVEPSDPAYPALQATLGRMGLGRVMACSECPDYEPEE